MSFARLNGELEKPKNTDRKTKTAHCVPFFDL
jgi:hypothetical protein